MFNKVWVREYKSEGPINSGTYKGLFMRNKNDNIEELLSSFLMGGNIFQDKDKVVYYVGIRGGVNYFCLMCLIKKQLVYLLVRE